MVRERILDGQLGDAELTMRDLRLIQDRFIATLKNMLHSRIAYPKDEDENRGEKRSAPDADTGGGRPQVDPAGR